ncbi:MAG: metallophosphoesterase [Saprospiraceae bacterium]
MKFWFFFTLGVLAILAFKGYISRGVYQATVSKTSQVCYTVFSLGTFIVGIIALLRTFPNGIIGLSTSTNFVIALMLSVLICELILGFFFVGDDLILFFKWLSEKKNSTENIDINSRRRFLKTTGLLFTTLPFASFLYGITKGKYNFEIFEQTLTFSDLPDAFDGFKIVQFSDLHSGGFDSYEDVKRGFDLIQNQDADLILFTGDLVNDLAEEIIPYKDLLKNLNAPFGKYSVLGNHDYSEDDGLFPDEVSKKKNFLAIQQHQEDAGFRLLNNANTKIEKGEEFIRLLGVENWGNGFIKEGDLDKAIEDCDENEFSILMSHDPTHWEKVVLKHPKHIHLTLSGHTHGAQMGIERMGIKWSPVQYIYKYWGGLYQELNQYIYVNRGFGFMGFAGRIGIPPEITTFTLRKGKLNYDK